MSLVGLHRIEDSKAYCLTIFKISSRCKMSAVISFVSNWSNSKAAGNSWNSSRNSSLPEFGFGKGLKRGVLSPISFVNRSYASVADCTTQIPLVTEPSITLSILLMNLLTRVSSSVVGSSPTSGGRRPSSSRVILSCSCSSFETSGSLHIHASVYRSRIVSTGQVPLQDKVEKLLSQGS